MSGLSEQFVHHQLVYTLVVCNTLQPMSLTNLETYKLVRIVTISCDLFTLNNTPSQAFGEVIGCKMEIKGEKCVTALARMC